MAKISFDAQDGSPVQEFNVVLPVAVNTAPVVTEAEVQAAADKAIEDTFVPPAVA